MSRTEWGAGERLADRAEITDQMYRYARATDWMETENHRAVFAAECTFASPHSGDMHGVDAVVEWMNRVLPQFEATQHHIANITITFTGEHTADAVSSVRAWHRYPAPTAGEPAAGEPTAPAAPTKPDMVLWGEYHDRWERIDGTWRIRVRRVLEAGIEPRRAGGAPNPRRAK